MGKILDVNRDGTFDIGYEDGREERDVPASDIRHFAGGSGDGSGRGGNRDWQEREEDRSSPRSSPARKYVRDEPVKREPTTALLPREFTQDLRNLGKNTLRNCIDSSPRQIFSDVDASEKGYLNRRDFKGCLVALVDYSGVRESFTDIFPGAFFFLSWMIATLLAS